MALTQWNDGRMDDLHRWLEATSKRTDNIGQIVAAHELNIAEINRERRTKVEQKWALILVILTVIIGQVTNFVFQATTVSKPPEPVTVRIVK